MFESIKYNESLHPSTAFQHETHAYVLRILIQIVTGCKMLCATVKNAAIKKNWFNRTLILQIMSS